MLCDVRARLTVGSIVGVMAVGLAVAGAALGAHGMTSPTVAGSYSTSNHSGAVKFFFSERDTKRHTSIIKILNFRFHDGCATAFTKIKATMRVNGRHYRFSYKSDDVTIGGEANHVEIAGRLFFSQSSNFPRIKGTVTLSDPDCAADPNGVIAFKATG
jgi:hypothetical protein